MSDEPDQSPGPFSGSDVLDVAREYYHIPVLLVILGLMAWIRTQAWENFKVDGQWFFAGNDAWYHLRQVQYTVDHWPGVMPFEVWTGFPNGNIVGQFGTLYDQLIATGALIIGLGNPSPEQVELAVLFAPVVFGTLVAIPTYLIGSRLGGKLGGLLGAAILLLLPGTFLQRGLVGFSDHNVAEPFFQAFAVAGLLIALASARREWPVFEQLVEWDEKGLRRVAGWSAIAGILTALYLYAWPPGVMLIGIVGAFFLVAAMSDMVSGRSPEHVGIVGAISMTVAGLLLLIPMGGFGFSVSDFTILQPLFAFAVAGGTVFLSWLGREWDERDLDEQLYPIAVIGLLIVGAVFVALLLPRLWGLLQNNIFRFVGFDATAAQRTIGEAQPFPSSRAGQLGLSGGQIIFLEYGTSFFTALLAGAWMLLKPHLATGDINRITLAAVGTATTVVFLLFPIVPESIGQIFAVKGTLIGILVVGAFLIALMVLGEYDAESLLVLVWSVFILAAAFTQIRFNYYLVVPVAVLNAYLLGEVIRYLDLSAAKATFEDIEASHVLAIATVLIVVLMPLVAPISFANQNGQNVPMQTAWEAGQNNGPGAVTRWDPTLEWMSQNTPAEGNYGGAGNADQLDYFGTYKQADDYDYPAGAYGVMSWWDYGHWITVNGERIPNANPFQQHADDAANYLLAPSEQDANNVLSEIDEDDAKTRYVAVDWKMVAPQSKFGAPVVFYTENESLTRSDMLQGQVYNPQGQNWITLKNQRYYESQMVRLYRYHGSAKRAQPVVVDFEQRTYDVQGQQIQVPTYNGTRQFRTMEAAQEYVRTDPTSSIGGISDYPQEDVKALQHYRLVKASGQYLAPTNYLQNAEFNYGNFPTWVKLFERVPGATIQGTAPPNTTVRANVEMQIQFPQKPGTFNYTQYAETGPDGKFEMTLPYSTTGYENWGPQNGYTNVSVRATGPYTFTAGTNLNQSSGEITQWQAESEVPEAAVIGEDTDTISVSLEKQVIGTLGGGNTQDGDSSGDSGNQSAVSTDMPVSPDSTGVAGDDTQSRSMQDHVLTRVAPAK